MIDAGASPTLTALAPAIALARASDPALAAAQSAGLSPALLVAAVLYVAAGALYVGVFADAGERVIRAARWALFAAFLAHGVDIGWRGVENMHPGSSVHEALGFFAWFMVGAYLVAAVKQRLQVAGSFVALAALVVLLVARLSPTGAPLAQLSLLGRIHIALAAVSVATLALPTALAVIYLLKSRQLKRKEFDGILLHGGAAALESHDIWAYRLVLVGFPVFTLALILGVIWVGQRASGFARPEYLFAALSWLAFAAVITAREAIGWRGRRGAWLTLLGFVAAVLVFAIYFARRVGW